MTSTNYRLWDLPDLLRSISVYGFTLMLFTLTFILLDEFIYLGIITLVPSLEDDLLRIWLVSTGVSGLIVGLWLVSIRRYTESVVDNVLFPHRLLAEQAIVDGQDAVLDCETVMDLGWCVMATIRYGWGKATVNFWHIDEQDDWNLIAGSFKGERPVDREQLRKLEAGEGVSLPNPRTSDGTPPVHLIPLFVKRELHGAIMIEPAVDNQGFSGSDLEQIEGFAAMVTRRLVQIVFILSQKKSTQFLRSPFPSKSRSRSPLSMQSSHKRPRAADVHALLEQSPVFSVLDKAGRSRLVKAFKWFYAVAGEAVVRPEAPDDHVYFVFHGRLQVYVDLDASGTYDDDEIVAELGRGSVLGHMEACQDAPYLCMAQAIRDTELGQISRALFSEIANDYPQIWKTIANESINRLHNVRAVEPNRSDTHYLTLMPLESFVEIKPFAQRLHEEMVKLEPTCLIDKSLFNEALGEDAADDDVDVWDETDRKTVGWLTEQESAHKFLTLQADASASAWTRRCLRSADRILFVAHGGSKQVVREVESLIVQKKMMSRWAKRELVLLYDDDVALPTNTREWLVLRPWIDQVHHIKPGKTEDVQRLARGLTRRAVGLVLGGGGARGCAHIGVIRALRELNIPMDYVAGTSAGAGFAAQVAHQWPNDRIEKEVWRGFVEMAPFQAYDIPFHSFMQKDRVKAPAASVYGETMIEDLWLPFSVSRVTSHQVKRWCTPVGVCGKRCVRRPPCRVFCPPLSWRVGSLSMVGSSTMSPLKT